MLRRLTSLTTIAAALALAAASPSWAADPVVPPGDPQPQPAPPKPAAMTISVDTGIYDKGQRWVLSSDKLLVRGKIDPFVDGQRITIELHRSSGELVDQASVKVEKGKGGSGKFQKRFDLPTDTRYYVVARHEATPEQEAATAKRQKFRAIAPKVTGYESTRLLQISLNRLAFVSPVNGHLDEATRRAVLAYRKTNHWAHTGSPTSRVFRTVFNGGGGFVLRYKSPSMHVEGDLSRQVLVLADNGHPVQIYTMSSGKPSTPTIRGTFKFYRRQPGTNAHGMVWSVYFHGGYAIHGYASVPATYPASHGCLRVPIPDSHHIYSSVRLGETIYVYK